MTPYWEALFNAMYVETEEQAEQTLEKLVLWCQRENPHLTEGEARAMQLSNLGWMFGEVAPETRAHAMKLYPAASHPIFGRHFGHTPEQVLRAGMTVGQAVKEGLSLQEAIKAAQNALNEAIEENTAPDDP
jgi:hypothetical protein